MNSSTTNFVSVQNLPIKKVHVGDIDIAYKTFGKGEPILLISGLLSACHVLLPWEI